MAPVGKDRPIYQDFQRQIHTTTMLEGRLPLSTLHHSTMDYSACRAGCGV
jgi:hypothetical protein